MNETLKNVLMIVCLGVIMWLTVVFIISAGMIIFVLFIIGLVIYGLYNIWEKFSKNELSKKEENFNTLKEEEKN